MKTFLLWMMSAILGAALGLLSALWIGGMLPGSPRLGGTVEIDGWTSDWSIGSEAADTYVRARIARHGLLALRKEEAVYFSRAHDDDGERLREDCVYRVSGGAFPADWWSVTLYDGDNRLPMNADGQLSFDKTQVASFFGGDEMWLFDVRADGAGFEDLPWVSSKNAGVFDLTLRLYRPSDALLSAPETALTMPAVTKLECDEEGA